MLPLLICEEGTNFIHEQVMDFTTQVKEFVKFFTPVSKQIVSMIYGNHDERYSKQTGYLDHIIPKQQQNEVNADLDDPRNYATACRMCNGFGNRTKFLIPKDAGFEKQVASVFEQKKKVITEKRREWYEYWSKNVKPKLAT